METRPYFLFGDILSNATAGAVVAVVTSLVVGESWPMVVAMLVGMLLGSVVSLVVATGLTLFFGAFEVMVPVMTTGMLVGMLTGMLTAMASDVMTLGILAGGGAAVGVLVLFAIYWFDARIRGARQWTS